MSVAEYSQELYEAVDKIRDSFWLEPVADEVETVMWYAGLTDLFNESSIDAWDWLIKKAQDILNLDMGR